jgi:transcriptional regulator GlxA family with amidase domain
VTAALPRLSDPRLSRASVAAALFDAAHFSRLFRENYGYPPSHSPL